MAFKRLTFEEALARHKPMKRSRLVSKKGKGFRGVRIDQADKFFSLFIRYRANWTSERCGTKYEVNSQGLHCSHFWGRAREATRFDPENASAHCHGCHAFFTANPALHCEWKLKQIGHAAYDRLMIRADSRQKKDRMLAAIVYKELYLKEKERFDGETNER